MIICGIWDGHDASAALVIDGRPVAALAEERPSRVKMKRGFPGLALASLLESAGLSANDVDLVAIAGIHGRAPLRLLERFYQRQGRGKGPMGPGPRLYRHYENLIPLLPGLKDVEAGLGRYAVQSRLREAGFPSNVRLAPVEHHSAHAFTAASLLETDGLVLTMDGYGDGLCATTWRFNRGRLLPTRRRSYLASSAVTYGSVCQLLGFKEGDEGKVTALAAAGDHTLLGPFFKRLLRPRLPLPGGGPLGPMHVRRLARHRSEDVAAGIQHAVTEQVVSELLQEFSADPFPRLALAGGLFANVALNRAIVRALPDTEVRVFPAMGDQGLSLGAALSASYDATGLVPPFLSPYMGPDPDFSDAIPTLSPPHPDEVVARCAATLEQGGLVALVTGRDEFGPRALGNRSLLFPATTTALADRVQGMLQRNPIMPFAPVCRAEQVELFFAPPYPVPSCPDYGLGWMTCAVAAKAETARRYPAAVHIDGTARVQAVTGDSSPLMYRILEEYERRSGLSILINTSFNMHNEPIVHSAADALRTYRRSGVDLMVLGDRLVSKEVDAR